MTELGSVLHGSKASRHLLDGATTVIPGYEGLSTDRAEQYSGDEFPYMIQTPELLSSAVGVEGPSFTRMVPFNSKIVSVSVVITTSGVLSGGVKINIGSATDGGLYVSGFALDVTATALDSGIGNLIIANMATDTIKDRTLTAGDRLVFTALGTTTGADAGDSPHCIVTAMIAPRL